MNVTCPVCGNTVVYSKHAFVVYDEIWGLLPFDWRKGQLHFECFENTLKVPCEDFIDITIPLNWSPVDESKENIKSFYRRAAEVFKENHRVQHWNRKLNK